MMKHCPYCGGRVFLRDASYVYHTDKYKGKVYVCENFPHCNSYVGCHPNSNMPLGRLADRKLRCLKSNAHIAFDPIWKQKKFNGSKSLSYNRRRAYSWLARQLGISEGKCHIGMFDCDMCRKVIKVCKASLEDENYIFM